MSIVGRAHFLRWGWEIMPMRSWQTEAGHLECRWSEAGQRVEYRPGWMEEARDIQSGYLPPITDFATHSPFGGTESWFHLHTSGRERKQVL